MNDSNGHPTTHTSSTTGSTMNVSEGLQSDVQRYFRSFGEALGNGDGKTIAQMWNVPAIVISSGESHTVQRLEEVEKFFSGAKEQYNKMGIYEAIPHVVYTRQLTEDILIAEVRWPYLTRNGETIGEESSTYTLQRGTDGVLKMRAIVMHGSKTDDTSK